MDGIRTNTTRTDYLTPSFGSDPLRDRALTTSPPPTGRGFPVGDSYEIAGVPQLVRWGGRAIGRALEDLGAGRLGGHMRNHFQRLASQAGKSIFRKPQEVPAMLTRTLEEARTAATRYGDELARGQTVRHGSTEVVQQGERLAITRQFDRPIGRDGETNLRVVVGRGGNVVTAYPVRMLGAGAFFGVTGLSPERANEMYRRFDDRVISTANEVRQAAERTNGGLWNEVVGLLDPTGILYAEPANASEVGWEVTRRGAEGAIADIEAGLGRRLSENERQVFAARFTDAVNTATSIQE